MGGRARRIAGLFDEKERSSKLSHGRNEPIRNLIFQHRIVQGTGIKKLGGNGSRQGKYNRFFNCACFQCLI